MSRVCRRLCCQWQRLDPASRTPQLTSPSPPLCSSRRKSLPQPPASLYPSSRTPWLRQTALCPHLLALPPRVLWVKVWRGRVGVHRWLSRRDMFSRRALTVTSAHLCQQLQPTNSKKCSTLKKNTWIQPCLLGLHRSKPRLLYFISSCQMCSSNINHFQSNVAFMLAFLFFYPCCHMIDLVVLSPAIYTVCLIILSELLYSLAQVWYTRVWAEPGALISAGWHLKYDIFHVSCFWTPL